MNARDAQRLGTLEARYRTLAAGLVPVGFISQGSVVASYTTCGKASCRCASDPDARHGPYWQWTSAVHGRTVGQRLTPSEAALYKQWITNQRTLDRIISRMQQISGSAGKILLRELRSGVDASTKAKRR
jgi:hypothetical protein